MKKAIIIIISALVVLGGTFAGLWFFTDVLNFLKPANENFSVQLDKVLGTEKNLSYSEYESKVSRLKIDGSYSTDFNVSMNVNVPSSVLSTSEQKLINSSSVNLKTDYDADSKVTAVAVALANDSKEVIKAQAIVDGVKLSVSCDDLYAKYLTFDLEKYESFCKQNGIEVDNDTKDAIEMLSKLSKIDSSTLLYDLCYVSEDDYKALQKRYDGLVKQLIDADKFTAEKNQKITVGDQEDIKTTAYSVVLTGEDAYEISNKFIDLVSEDDTLKKILIEKYDIVKDYVSSYGEVISEYDSSVDASDLPDLTTSDLDELFDDMKEALEYDKEYFEDMEGAIKVTIYSDKKNNPVKVEIAILEDEDDDDGSVVFTKEIENGKDTYTIDLSDFVGSNSYDYYSSSSSIESVLSSISAIKIVDEYEKTDDSRNGTLTISVKANGSKFEKALTIDYEIVNSNSEEKLKLSVKTPLYSSVSLDLLYDITGLDSNEKKLTFNLSGKYNSYSISLNIDGTIKSGANIPTLNSSNSVDVLTLNQEELTKLYSEIITNASNNLPAKLSTYGMNVTTNDILSLLPQQTTTTEVAPEEAPAEVPAT